MLREAAGGSRMRQSGYYDLACRCSRCSSPTRVATRGPSSGVAMVALKKSSTYVATLMWLRTYAWLHPRSTRNATNLTNEKGLLGIGSGSSLPWHPLQDSRGRLRISPHEPILVGVHDYARLVPFQHTRAQEAHVALHAWPVVSNHGLLLHRVNRHLPVWVDPDGPPDLQVECMERGVLQSPLRDPKGCRQPCTMCHLEPLQLVLHTRKAVRGHGGQSIVLHLRQRENTSRIHCRTLGSPGSPGTRRRPWKPCVMSQTRGGGGMCLSESRPKARRLAWTHVPCLLYHHK